MKKKKNKKVFVQLNNFSKSVIVWFMNRIWMVEENRFGNNFKIKKKIVGSIEKYDYYYM